MAGFVKGDIVVLPFPFSDLSGSKKRPALVLADLPGNDIILCQITSQLVKDHFSIPLTNADFLSGSLPVVSNIRPTRIFTADKNIITRKAGTIKDVLTDNVVKKNNRSNWLQMIFPGHQGRSWPLHMPRTNPCVCV